MTGKDQQTSRTSVPTGYSAVALCEDHVSHPLKVCILVRDEPDPVAGSLVILRENPDSRVLLGCFTDADGRVLRWVEVWIQNVSGAAALLSFQVSPPTNRTLDARWRKVTTALADLSSSNTIATGWESRNPSPLFVTTDTRRPFHPVLATSGKRWALCTDDALLTRHGLPAYSDSAHRYWSVESDDETEPTFVPVTPGAPTVASTIALEDIVRPDGGLISVNPECGLIRVCPHQDLSYEEFLFLLAGGSREVLQHGRSVLDLGGRRSELADADAPGLLLTGVRGASAQLLEVLHLKVGIFHQSLALVHALVKQQQRPFLNLSTDSVRVGIGTNDDALPLLWTARPQLAVPGTAITVSLPATDRQYHLAPEGLAPSVYRAASGSGRPQARATLRLRSVLQEGPQGVIIEGTYHPSEDLAIDRSDLVWVRLSLEGRPLDLCGHVETDRALAPGEWRFRSVPHQLGESLAATLKQAEGVRFENVPSEILALLSAPCDLYAMAVIGVRTFLVNESTTLAVALDECLSLARVVDQSGEGEDIPSRVASVFANDPRWPKSLGPDRLMNTAMGPDEALACVPPALWWQTLAMLIKMFPGVGDVSTCRDLGDAPAGRQEAVFDQAISDVGKLLNETRSMMVNDLRANREIREAVAAVRESR